MHVSEGRTTAVDAPLDRNGVSGVATSSSPRGMVPTVAPAYIPFPQLCQWAKEHIFCALLRLAEQSPKDTDDVSSGGGDACGSLVRRTPEAASAPPLSQASMIRAQPRAALIGGNALNCFVKTSFREQSDDLDFVFLSSEEDDGNARGDMMTTLFGLQTQLEAELQQRAGDSAVEVSVTAMRPHGAAAGGQHPPHAWTMTQDYACVRLRRQQQTAKVADFCLWAHGVVKVMAERFGPCMLVKTRNVYFQHQEAPIVTTWVAPPKLLAFWMLCSITSNTDPGRAAFDRHRLQRLALLDSLGWSIPTGLWLHTWQRSGGESMRRRSDSSSTKKRPPSRSVATATSSVATKLAGVQTEAVVAAAPVPKPPTPPRRRRRPLQCVSVVHHVTVPASKPREMISLEDKVRHLRSKVKALQQEQRQLEEELTLERTAAAAHSSRSWDGWTLPPPSSRRQGDGDCARVWLETPSLLEACAQRSRRVAENLASAEKGSVDAAATTVPRPSANTDAALLGTRTGTAVMSPLDNVIIARFSPSGGGNTNANGGRGTRSGRPFPDASAAPRLASPAVRKQLRQYQELADGMHAHLRTLTPGRAAGGRSSAARRGTRVAVGTVVGSLVTLAARVTASCFATARLADGLVQHTVTTPQFVHLHHMYRESLRRLHVPVEGFNEPEEPVHRSTWSFLVEFCKRWLHLEQNDHVTPSGGVTAAPSPRSEETEAKVKTELTPTGTPVVPLPATGTPPTGRLEARVHDGRLDVVDTTLKSEEARNLISVTFGVNNDLRSPEAKGIHMVEARMVSNLEVTLRKEADLSLFAETTSVPGARLALSRDAESMTRLVSRRMLSMNFPLVQNLLHKVRQRHENTGGLDEVVSTAIRQVVATGLQSIVPGVPPVDWLKARRNLMRDMHRGGFLQQETMRSVDEGEVEWSESITASVSTARFGKYYLFACRYDDDFFLNARLFNMLQLILQPILRHNDVQLRLMRSTLLVLQKHLRQVYALLADARAVVNTAGNEVFDHPVSLCSAAGAYVSHAQEFLRSTFAMRGPSGEDDFEIDPGNVATGESKTAAEVVTNAINSQRAAEFVDRLRSNAPQLRNIAAQLSSYAATVKPSNVDGWPPVVVRIALAVHEEALETRDRAGALLDVLAAATSSTTPRPR